MTSLVGQNLGQYQVIRLIGEGGMAAVYQATQTSMKRDVAIKAIKPNLVDMADFATRFEHEAQIVASLSHAHILKVFDYGVHEDIVYIVMELLTGGSLDQLIQKGPMSLQQAGTILDQIAGALDYAHNKGIVHRDLKPENVLLDESGSAFLTDFGLAKLVNSSLKLTQSGATIGTPAYMAPEQWRAQPLDARTDVYALGVVLYEMLTGEVPFKGDTALSMMYLHLHEPPRTLQAVNPGVPPAVENVVQRALAKDPNDRYQSAGQLAAAYREAVENPTVRKSAVKLAPKSAVKSPNSITGTVPKSAVQPAVKGTSALQWVAIAVLVLALIGLGILGVSRLSNPPVLPTAASVVQVATATQPPATQVTGTVVASATGNATVSTSTTPLASASKGTSSATTVPATAAATQTTKASDTATPAPSKIPTVAATATPLPTLDSKGPLPGGPTIAGALTLVGHSAPVNSVAFAPNGKYVASASDDGTVRLWTTQNGQQVRIFKGLSGPVNSVAFSPNSSVVAGGGPDQVIMWDVVSGLVTKSLDDNHIPVNSVAFSPNGLLVLTGTAKGAVKLWDANTGNQSNVLLAGHADAVNHVMFSHDGTLILTASSDHTAAIWNTKTGALIQVLKGHTGPVRTAIFSPNDDYVLTGSLDGTARFWQTADGKQIGLMDNLGVNVLAVAFPPDGHEALLGSEDGTVWGWNALTGKRVHELTGHTVAVRDIAFGPLGVFFLATGVADNTVRLWPLPQPPGQGSGPGPGAGQGPPPTPPGRP